MNQEEYEQTDRTLYWELRYQEWLKNPDPGIFKAKADWFNYRFSRILPIPETPKGNVLEVGCGNAMYSVPLLQRFKGYIGFDTSATAIEIARSYLPFNLHRAVYLKQSRDIEMSILSESMDCVVSITVLQHMTIEERRGTIEEIKRVLKPGGLYLGLEMQNGHAPDMPHWNNEEWLEAWKPLELVYDAPEDHPEWAGDNVWVGRKP